MEIERTYKNSVNSETKPCISISGQLISACIFWVIIAWCWIFFWIPLFWIFEFCAYERIFIVCIRTYSITQGRRYRGTIVLQYDVYTTSEYIYDAMTGWWWWVTPKLPYLVRQLRGTITLLHAHHCPGRVKSSSGATRPRGDHPDPNLLHTSASVRQQDAPSGVRNKVQQKYYSFGGQLNYFVVFVLL